MSEEIPEIEFNGDNLYREETYTDNQAGILRVLVPVTKEGADDPGRATQFLGSTQLMTQMGALPINFEIEAANLAEAVEKYPEAAKQGIIDTIEKIKEMRREQASSIVVPGAGGGMGGMPGGGMPGGGPGGGIQMP